MHQPPVDDFARHETLLRAAMRADPNNWTTTRVAALFAAHDMPVDTNTCWGYLRHVTQVAPEPHADGSLFDLAELDQ